MEAVGTFGENLPTAWERRETSASEAAADRTQTSTSEAHRAHSTYTNESPFYVLTFKTKDINTHSKTSD